METNDPYIELSHELFEQLTRLRRGMHPSTRNSMRGEMAVIRALHLATVAGEADLTPSQIAECSHLTPARVANVLRALEEKGWIERSHDTEDRRRVTVTLTEQGEAERARRRAEFDAHGAEFLRELGEQDVREALRILKRCNEIVSTRDTTQTRGGDADENHQAL